MTIVRVLLLALLAGCGAATPLRIGSSGDYPPFSVRDQGGEWRGFDVEVARAYARAARRRPTFVQFRWPELARAMARGDFDVAMSGVTVRPERLITGRFTAAVARADAVLIARRDRRPARRVAVNRGGHLERVARRTLPKDVTLVPVDDNLSLPVLLREGSADGVVTDTAEAGPLLAADDVDVTVLSRDRKAYWLPVASAELAADMDRWLLVRERDGWLPALRARDMPGQRPSPLPPATAWVTDLLGRRLLLMPAVAAAKRRAGMPVDDPGREAVVEERARVRAQDAGLAAEPYLRLVRAQMEAAKAVQRAEQPRDTPEASLADLRGAIDRADDAIATALRAAVPITTSRADLLAALRENADVPGANDAALGPIADALVQLRGS